MTGLVFRYLWFILLIGSALTNNVLSQQLKVSVYRAKVITKEGKRFRGTLEYITEEYLYVSDQNKKRSSDFIYHEEIPTDLIRKVVIRRVNKKSAIITGASIGGLVTGYLGNESLKRNRPSNSVAYGLTLTFAAAGGAAAGLLLGSAVGNLTNRVVRPLDSANPGVSLFRQLEPFSTRYQQDFIDRLPQNNN